VPTSTCAHYGLFFWSDLPIFLDRFWSVRAIEIAARDLIEACGALLAWCCGFA